jgi:plasmid stabilization system protein ParE
LAYKVIITPAAQRDAEEFIIYLRGKMESESAVSRWLSGLFRTIRTLEEMPDRCPLLREGRWVGQTKRELTYASHRIVFRHNETTVTVLRIYHSSRRALR